jgi:hypothetical protein
MCATQMTRRPLNPAFGCENSSGNKKDFGRGRGNQGQRGRGGCQGQRGRGANGRSAATTPRTSFDDSDEEAFKTPDSVESSAHSTYETVVVCKSIRFEKSPENEKLRVEIVNDIHEQNLQTDLTL